MTAGFSLAYDYITGCTSVLKEIMTEYAPGFKNEDLLALYLLTGGVAKYVELLVDKKRLTRDKLLD